MNSFESLKRRLAKVIPVALIMLIPYPGDSQTPCNSAASPFYTGFDSVKATSSFPAGKLCWDTIGVETAYQLSLTKGGYHYFSATEEPVSPPNMLNFNYDGLSKHDTNLLISPTLKDLSSYNNRLRLQAAFSDTANSRLYVGVMKDPPGKQSLRLVDTLSARPGQSAGSWREFLVNFDNPSIIGKAEHIVLAKGDEHAPISIDNIHYEQIPSCVKPYKVSTDRVWNDSAKLSWQSRDNGNRWLISYDSGDFNPAKGRKHPVTKQTNSTLGGLFSNTDYKAYVRQVCANGDTSAFSRLADFTTFCDPLTAPYQENFDGQSAARQSTTFERLFCWSAKGEATHRINLISNAFGHEPDTPPSAPNHISLSYDGLKKGDKSVLVSPSLSDLSNYQNRIRVQVSFDDDDAGLQVGVVDKTMNLSNVRVVDTLTARPYIANNEWAEYTVNFDDPSIIQNANRIIMAGKEDHTSVSIDNITYEAIPDCEKPGNLIVTELGYDFAKLAWSAPNQSGEWLITYDTAGFNPNTGGKTISAKNVGKKLQGLSSNKQYEAYVRSICQNGDTSSLSYRVKFRTYCPPFQAPYSQGFDGIALEHSEGFGKRRFCWRTPGQYQHLINLEPRNYSTKNSGANNNEVSFRSRGFTNGDTALLISPLFSDLGALDKRVTVDVAFESTGQNKLYAGVIGDAMDPSTFTILDSFMAKPDQSDGEFRRFYLRLNNGRVINDQQRLAFTGKDPFVWYFIDEVNIDNVTYEKAPACPTPNWFKVTNKADSTASLTWQSQGDGNEWLVKVDTPGFNPSQNGEEFVFSNSSGTITNLKPDTRYQAYVREICSRGDTGIYEQRVRFKTACQTPPAPVTLPFNEGFDSFKGSYRQEAKFCSKGPAVWEFSSDNENGRIRFRGYNPGHGNSGRKAATLDGGVSHTLTVNDLILTLNMSNYSVSKPHFLEFSYKSYQGRDNPNDQVWIRGSKQDSWLPVYQLDSSTGGDYKQVGPLNIAKNLRKRGQAFTKNFQVRFGQEGSYKTNGHPSAGRSFDNIRITSSGIVLTAMAEPSQTCGLSEQEELAVAMENRGNETVPANTPIRIGYSVNGKAYPSRQITLNQPLNNGDTRTSVLNSSMKMNGFDTTYRIKAWLERTPTKQKTYDTFEKVMHVPAANHSADHVLDTSALIKWDNTKATTYTRVIWGAKGFNPMQAGKSFEVSNNNHHLAKGLQPGKKYDVYTQEICSNGDTGSLRGPSAFRTRQFANNIRTLGIPEPANECGLTANEPWSVQFMNYGHDTIPANTDITLNYRKNEEKSGQKQIQLAEKLGPTDTLRYTLNERFDFAEEGRSHHLQTWLDWNQDSEQANDSAGKFIYVSKVPDRPIPNHDTSCVGDQTLLTVKGSTDHYDWYAGKSGSPVKKQSDRLQVKSNQDTTFYVKAYNHVDSCKSSFSSVNATVYQQPEVSFKADTPCANQTLNLQGQAKQTRDKVKEFQWDLWELPDRKGKHARITYESAGVYPVSLKAKTLHGCQASNQKTIKVKPAPEADFTFKSNCEGSPVFLQQAARPQNGPNRIQQYRWHLEDAPIQIDTNATHTYNKPGEYEARLMVQSANNCWDTAQKTIQVKNAPNPAFTINKRSPKTVSLKPKDTTADAYSWDFGDGSQSEAKRPVHTYDKPGTYNISLSTQMANGCRKIGTQQVNVKKLAFNANLNAYPNPVGMNESIQVNYIVPEKQDVNIQLKTLTGREVYNKALSQQTPGKYQKTLTTSGRFDNSGIYILQVWIGDDHYEKQITVLP